MIEVSRRSFLQSLVVGATALALPVKVARPLPVSSEWRLAIPLLTEHPLLPIHLAEAFAQMEIWDNRVGILFMSPKRALELQHLEVPSTFALKLPSVWGAELAEVDLPDNLIVLEAAPGGTFVDRGRLRQRPIDLEPRSI